MKTTEFKDSELGPIPKEWEVKRLGDCLTVLRNGFAYDFREQGSYSITRIETIAEGVIDINRVGKCNSCPGDEYLMREGDILYSHINSLQHIGKCAYYSMPGLLYHGMNLLLMRCNKTLTPRFLFALLNTHRMRELARTTAKVAVNQASINTRELKELPILLPPLAEQRRIAEVLGKTDEYIEALKKLIEKRKNVKRGAMQELLTGKRRLPGFEGEWVEKRLGEIADLSTVTVSVADIDMEWYVGTENMLPNCQGVEKNSSPISYESVREYKNGDILISNIRPYLKKAWLANRSGGCSTDVLVIRVKQGCCSEFVYSALSSDKFFSHVMDNAVGTKMPRGDKKVIVAYDFMLPPSLSEQKAIAKVLSEMDEGIEALEKKLKKVEAIKEGMMQDLLTGKVRLKEDWT